MVFEDPTRRRLRRFRWMVGATVVGACLMIGAVIAAVTVAPRVVTPALPTTPAAMRLSVLEGPATPKAVERAPVEDGPDPFGLMRIGFVLQGSSHSMDMLRTLHSTGSALDAVIPDYYCFSTATGQIDINIDPAAEEAMLDSGADIWPRLSNTTPQGVWTARHLSALLRDADASSALISNTIDSLVQHKAAGLNLDIEDLNPDDGELFLDWVATLRDALHRNNMLLSVDLPLNDETYDYEAMGQIADYVVVMAYDQSYPRSKPGPVAGCDWFIDGVTDMAKRIEADKLLVAIGAYGYDWDLNSPSKEAESLTFAEALTLAESHRSTLETSPGSINLHFDYTDAASHRHSVWLLDAVSAWNHFQAIKDNKVAGVAVWRLGSEDPTIWKFLAKNASHDFEPSDLAIVPVTRDVQAIGEGEIYSVVRNAVDGVRELTFDEPTISKAVFRTLPAPAIVEKRQANAENLVVLTFDDGPDPQWTPKLLDVLRRHQTKATFFVVGDQVRKHPDLVKRIVDEGHIVGNHTFTHSDIRRLGRLELENELNTCQRAIEAASGVQTSLFRAPYDTDSSPTTPEQLAALHTVTQMGYLSIGADVDSVDYKRHGAEEMFTRVMEGSMKRGPHVVLMHDGGGNRQQTIDAVDAIIPALLAKGRHIGTVADLAGVAPSNLMPQEPQSELLFVELLALMRWLRTTGWEFMQILFAFTTGLAVFRIVGLGILATRRRAPSAPIAESDRHPPVCVLIPAYNEGAVIERTIHAVLASNYPHLSVLVVDDGSTDDTAARASKLAESDPRIRVLTKPNGGKSSSLNFGLKHVAEDVIVSIDADTIILPGAIHALAERMADPEVDAVCGNVQVGNNRKLLTALQDVEYVTSQNYDRRAFEVLNCISVVPGATGAWRRSSVIAAGGYSHDTLTEDADLTFAILRQGGRIVYAPLARSLTEAPESVLSLFKQRFRWSYGTLQVLWKHRAALGRGGLGLVAMPNMILFQVIFPLLAPLGDIILVLSLLRGDFNAVAVGYVTFLMMDLVGSAIAFALDRRSPRSMWVVLIQRFCYRQFLYVVTLRSLIAAIVGRRHGWNKLERLATVEHHPSSHSATEAA